MAGQRSGFRRTVPEREIRNRPDSVNPGGQPGAVRIGSPPGSKSSTVQTMGFPARPRASTAALPSRTAGRPRAGPKEIPSTVIGETVVERLKAIDPVAYVRFASVYRDFRDVGEFMTELEGLARRK